jgi:hypothetical protein
MKEMGERRIRKWMIFYLTLSYQEDNPSIELGQ